MDACQKGALNEEAEKRRVNPLFLSVRSSVVQAYGVPEAARPPKPDMDFIYCDPAISRVARSNTVRSGNGVMKLLSQFRKEVSRTCRIETYHFIFRWRRMKPPV